MLYFYTFLGIYNYNYSTKKKLLLMQNSTFKLLMITNDPLKAKILSDNGVDRIFVDLEI
ncbi:MAG: hypothetical protein CM15mP19_00070 [Gammaproteobacteria bacterium]|nr:MAG: hypothetical protein CM15mP19_00070 [Gammaproteobacteria bacterium]